MFAHPCLLLLCSQWLENGISGQVLLLEGWARKMEHVDTAGRSEITQIQKTNTLFHINAIQGSYCVKLRGLRTFKNLITTTTHTSSPKPRTTLVSLGVQGILY